MTKSRILIFIIGVNAIAWGAVIIVQNLIEDSEVAASIAVAIMALGPLFMAVTLRLIFRESWINAGLKLNVKGNGKWYSLALVLPLLVIGGVYLLALVSGMGHWDADLKGSLLNVLIVSATLAIPMFSASIGEEFGWRGYLEPNLQHLTGSAMISHLIVGTVWGIWHFPLLIFNVSSVSPTDLVMVLVGCIALGFIYGQLRIRTGSVWPCVLLHAVTNIFNIAFVTSKLMVIDDADKWLVSLNSTSVAVTGTWIVIGLVLFKSSRTGRLTRQIGHG